MRLGASQRFSRSSTSSLGSAPRSSPSSSISGESGTSLNMRNGVNSDGEGTGLSLWEWRSATGPERITGARESQMDEGGEQGVSEYILWNP